MKKRTWWSLNLRRWMNKMTSTQLMQNYTRSPKNMRSCIGILNSFTATVNPTERIVEDVDEEEDLVQSKFEKMDEQDDIHTTYTKLYKVSEKHDKLYRLVTNKLSEVELEREEISTKFDEVNQTIGAMRFENNFIAKKTKEA